MSFASIIHDVVIDMNETTLTGRIPVTLSGWVAYHAVGKRFDVLLARADKKLDEAKERGRNRIKD